MALTFKGGIHADEHKNTRRSQIRRMPAPADVFIPLLQHIGAPCEATVAVGDKVLRGQVIGRPTGLGVPVHSSVSGTVKEIIVRYDARGRGIQTVHIENDGENTLSPDVKPYEGSLAEAKSEDIVEIVKNAGICGMGGAGFPSYAKIQSAIGKAEVLIINCAECEPYITANHRLLLENPAAVINGTKILLKAIGVSRAIIAIEDNKRDAANKLEELIVDEDMITVKLLKTKYPQGDERQLTYVLTGKQIPAGKLPADVGAVIFNTETTASIYQAFAHGMPLIERTVTVDGDCINNPKNVLVPIGTPISALIDFCGGYRKEPKKLVNGGPMMGSAIWDVESPVTKTTSAILALSGKAAYSIKEDFACIRCGKCVAACPMRLMPIYLAQYSQVEDLERCEEFDVNSCIECGSCTYTCPGQVPIVQFIRVAKGKIREKKMAAKVAEERTKKEEKND